MSTIKDVARAAGVSVSTVSNIINNKSSVNIEIYNRVMQVMKELNYRPNILAMNLRKNHMNFIGVVFDELSDHSARLLEGTVLRLEQLEYQAIIRSVKANDCEISKVINHLLSIGVKGIILCTPRLEETALQQFYAAGVPILMLDYCLRLPGFLTVDFDNAPLVRELTLSLCRRHKSVGLVTGPCRFACEQSCRTGFGDGLTAAKAEEEPAFMLELPFQRGILYEKLLIETAKSHPLPACFIVSNEFMAYCLNEALSINGRQGHMIYVLSCQKFERPATSNMVMLERDAMQCAQDAVDMLISQLRDPVLNDSPGKSLVPELPTSFSDVRGTSVPAHFPKKVLRVLLPDSPMNKSIQLLSQDFTNQTGISVQFTLKNMTELCQEIVHSCQNAAPQYDVVTFHINWLSRLTQHHHLLPLDEHLDLEALAQQYLPQVRKAYFQQKHARYGLPAEMGIQVLAYRDDLFSDPVVQKSYYNAVGLELQPPRSWTEFNIIARYFTRAYNPASPVKYGTCIAGHVPTGLIEEFWPRSWAFRGKIFDKQGLALYSPQNVKALENLCDSYRCSYPNCQTFMDAEQVQQMLNGDIAMIVTYSSYMVLGGMGRDKQIKFSHTPSNMTAIDSYLLGIPANCTVPESSTAFIQWCCSDSIAAKSLLLGRLIPKTNVVLNGEIEYLNQGLKGIFDNLEEAVSRNYFFTERADAPAFDASLADGLAQAVYGGVPAEQVLRDLQALLAQK